MSECMTQEDAMNMSNEQAIQILKPLREMMIDQHGCPVSDAVFALDKAIEALSQHQPERKTGKWKKMQSTWFHNDYQCSVCGNTLDFNGLDAGRGDANYCPNCGADMRGEGHETD